MKLDDTFHMRRLDEQDLEQFNALLRYAFQVTTTEMVKTGWSEEEIKREKLPMLTEGYVLGWFHNEHLASQIVIYPMEVNVEGEIVKMGGITGVTTYPEYAGRGLIHKLMAKCLGYPFVDPADCVFFKDDGAFDSEHTNGALHSVLTSLGRAVIPGFYGSMPNDTIRTFSRGGSDITGSIVARAVDADLAQLLRGSLGDIRSVLALHWRSFVVAHRAVHARGYRCRGGSVPRVDHRAALHH